MSRVFVSILCLFVLGACASSTVTSDPVERCRRRADEQYRLCVNPQYFGTGEPVTRTRSDEIQACMAAHAQALSLCAPPQVTPVPVLTSSTAAPSSAP